MKPVLKYPGAKWTLAGWIISHMPAHTAYLEPFFGSGAVFFNKPPSKVETINDIDGQVVNLFKQLRDRPDDMARLMELTPWSRDEYVLSWQRSDDPLESARRFLVKCWQAYGARLDYRSGWRHEKKGVMRASTYHSWGGMRDRIMAATERLRGVQIENRPAIKLIREHKHPGTLIYADPPYPSSTRGTKLYAFEMSDEDHSELLHSLINHPGPVVISGYANPLYDGVLSGWRRQTTQSLADGNRKREEIIWCNRDFPFHQVNIFELVN